MPQLVARGFACQPGLHKQLFFRPFSASTPTPNKCKQMLPPFSAATQPDKTTDGCFVGARTRMNAAASHWEYTASYTTIYPSAGLTESLTIIYFLKDGSQG